MPTDPGGREDSACSKDNQKMEEGPQKNRRPVWLVNDDAAQLMVQKRLLGKIAPDVRGFLSPLEALAEARQTEDAPYLVTDFQMPMMDGPELALQWWGLFPDTRVLVVSASEVPTADLRRIDALPADSVRLLTSYRIAELPQAAELWLFSVNEQLRASGEQEPENKAFDHGVLRTLIQLGGEEFVRKTVDRFIRSAPEKIQGLRLASHVPDLPTLSALAHSLKGSCGLVGALALAEVADRLEQAAAENSESDWEALVTELEQTANEAFITLRRAYP